jgi:hypothetical protein
MKLKKNNLKFADAQATTLFFARDRKTKMLMFINNLPKPFNNKERKLRYNVLQ